VKPASPLVQVVAPDNGGEGGAPLVQPTQLEEAAGDLHSVNRRPPLGLQLSSQPSDQIIDAIGIATLVLILPVSAGRLDARAEAES